MQGVSFYYLIFGLLARFSPHRSNGSTSHRSSRAVAGLLRSSSHRLTSRTVQRSLGVVGRLEAIKPVGRCFRTVRSMLGGLAMVHGAARGDRGTLLENVASLVLDPARFVAPMSSSTIGRRSSLLDSRTSLIAADAGAGVFLLIDEALAVGDKIFDVRASMRVQLVDSVAARSCSSPTLSRRLRCSSRTRLA